MLDKLAMIAMLILYIIVGITALFTYLVVRGGSQNKTEWEQINDDDDEQMEIVSKRKNRRKKQIGNK